MFVRALRMTIAALFLPLVLSPILAAQGGAISQSVSRMSLYINIVEGENALNNIRDRTAREPIVQIVDENHKPVQGAAVTFTSIAGPTGAGATFGGVLTYRVLTDAEGKAVARGFTPNSLTGAHKIEVTATLGMMTAAMILIHENNVVEALAGAGPGSALTTVLSSPVKLAIAGAGAATATGVGTYLAVRGDDTATPAITTATPAAPAAVPEIDPSMAFGGLILLAGCIAVLRGR